MNPSAAQDEIVNLMNEALVYLQSSEPSLAEDSYASALSEAESTLGESHPMTLKCLECLARVYKMQGGTDKTNFAVALYEKLIDIKDQDRNNKTSQPSEMVNVYAELGDCYKILGMLDEALKMESRAEKAFAIMKEKFERGDDDDDDVEEDEEDDEDDDDDNENDGERREVWNEEEGKKGESKEGDRWKL
jgi:tetratricopeptide (TPR) repeat protein